MNVSLSTYEQELAYFVGSLRRKSSRMKKGQRGLEEYDETKLLNMDVEGAACEIAAAKAFNRYWHGSWDVDPSLPDVGKNIQVRGTHRPEGRLILTDRSEDDQFHVLVVGKMPHYRVCGYIKGSEGKKERYRQAPAGRPPAYFIPQSALKPVVPK